MPGGVSRRVQGGTLYADGAWRKDRYHPYAVLLDNSNDRIEKFLVIPRSRPNQQVHAQIWIQCSLGGRGEIVVTVNDHVIEQVFPTNGKEISGTIRLAVPFLRLKNYNQITLQVKKGSYIKIGVDDAENYGRSRIYRVTGSARKASPSPLLDTKTALRFRRGHIPRGELQIGIFIKTR